MKVYTVKSLSSKKENICLIIGVIFILMIATILLKIRIKPIYSQEIGKNEISSYKDLNNIELGLYSEILNSLVEIEMLTEGERLPSTNILEREEIPPFYKDVLWDKKGEMSWRLIYHKDVPLYIGITNNMDIGNFIIEINKEEINSSEIYYLSENINFDIVEEKYDDIKQRVKKIVPYTGKEERRKFRKG